MKASILKTCALAVLLLFVGCKTRPEACFQVVEPDFVVPDRPIQFEDCSLNGSNWSWDFGDGTSSTDRNPQKVYTSPGTYQVKQVVENEKGKVDSTSIDLEVKRLFLESFTITSFPAKKPNGDPWDPDLSGADVRLSVTHAFTMPAFTGYVSPIVQNLQSQLPYTYEIGSSNLELYCCSWYFMLTNENATTDTILFGGPPYEDLIQGPVWEMTYPNSLSVRLQFESR